MSSSWVAQVRAIPSVGSLWAVRWRRWAITVLWSCQPSLPASPGRAEHHTAQEAQSPSKQRPAALTQPPPYWVCAGRPDSKTRGISKRELEKVSCYEKVFLQIEFLRASWDQISKVLKGFHSYHPLGKLFHQLLDFSIRGMHGMAKLFFFYNQLY